MWGDSKGSGSSGRQGSSMKADPGKKVVVHHVPTSNQTESADAVVESAASTHARRGDDAHIDEKVFLSYHEASVAMTLPEPYVTQRNLKLVLVEDYVRLASFVKSDPFSVSPLGYYKSPDGFDIYVFECTLGSVDRPSHLKRWKIHRRYRHFDMLLSRLMDPSSSSSSSAAATARWPSLSGSYLQMFRAKHCKDRLIELHTWLVKAVELLQTFPATSADTTTGDKSHVLFTCFLFAGANTPYVTFPSLPLFAWALEQVHVQLTLSPLYPSRVPNQHAAGGLGLRLAPSTGRADDETGGTIYRGAVVTGFLRDSFDVPNVQYVRLGSHLSHINGVPIENETFDTILLHLRSQSRPMFLTFTLDPRPSSLECQLSEADLRRHDRALSASSMISGSRRTSAASSMDVADVQTPMSVLGSVFHDTLGGSRKRTETMISDNNQDEDDGLLLLCWDDVSGLGMDTVTTGMYLPQTQPAASTPTVQEASGIWSTSAGPLRVRLSACKLQGKPAVFLSVTPQRFGVRNTPLPSQGGVGGSQASKRGKKQPPEIRLERGMVLVSVNNMSTFDLSFHDTMALVTQASIPTSLCFRWFNDYSLFLNPNSDQAMPLIHRPSMSTSATSPEADMAGLVEAHTKLCSSWHQALVENASLRVELHIVQESNRHLRDAHQMATKAHTVRPPLRSCRRRHGHDRIYETYSLLVVICLGYMYMWLRVSPTCVHSLRPKTRPNSFAGAMPCKMRSTWSESKFNRRPRSGAKLR
ncbi:hypothetical protein, variant 1 [Aphanomyces astaci]|uniref:PX domain-containing protein n=1 Tax=Aphanomyces astaci TaxID=112090 RepID=W4FG32_APHAT|nr:hypothetical protein, variant 1 [Aphanomyces astaci]ETV66400.1 hypothetical protein, variant 1 [Aphanomyces astaci]|eukprot:XP_009844175.1 hypothetical protein, variant 1 [Aphanomyces astaci]